MKHNAELVQDSQDPLQVKLEKGAPDPAEPKAYWSKIEENQDEVKKRNKSQTNRNKMKSHTLGNMLLDGLIQTHLTKKVLAILYIRTLQVNPRTLTTSP